ncbi:hypothetical protein DFH29DRAFT_1027718 [Suillus ampliporus]|nr:hypothetical protein DFH29DRAFT_1027718 [Suillus ampliporus]
MRTDMEQYVNGPDVHSDYRSSPLNPADSQVKGKVRSFLPGFVDRAIFRTKAVSYQDSAESLLKAQLKSERMEAQKLRVANRGLRTSLVASNKEWNKAMQSEKSEIIEAYNSELRDMNERNMRQGAQVIKLQSRLFDQDEHIAHLKSLEVSNSVIETVDRKTSREGASPPDTGSQGGLMKGQAVAQHEPRPQSTEPAVAATRNSTVKHEPERRRKLVKRQRDAVHGVSERSKDIDPFASEPNLAPHRRIRSIGQVLVDAREREAKTISELEDAHRKKDEQRPAQACYDHQAEFTVYQDHIATLTSECDTLSRKLKRSTRMADSNASLLSNLELQAQRLLFEHDTHLLEHDILLLKHDTLLLAHDTLLLEHDTLLLEHQQGMVRLQQQIRELETTQLDETTASALREKEHRKVEQRLQQQIRELETQLEKTTASASREKEHCKMEHEQLPEVDCVRSAENHGERTTLDRLHTQLRLANSLQAMKKRKLRKMEIASQQALENIEPLHGALPKAQGSIFGRLSKRLSRIGNHESRQVSLPAAREVVKNERAVAEPSIRPPLATSSVSSPPASAHEVDGVASKHARRTLSCLPKNPPVTETSSRDVPNDTLDVSTASILSESGMDLLLPPSQGVACSNDNGLASLYSMLSVARLYAPSPIRGPPEIRPRRRNVDPLKIQACPNAETQLDDVVVGQTWSLFHR